MKKIWLIPLALLITIGLLAWRQSKPTAGIALEPAPGTITANMINTKGEKIGWVKLKQLAEGVHIEVQASGLTPGQHGFHVHQKGLCEPPKFESAGEHFNPTGKEHGFHNPKGYHAGDLPNVTADAKGNVHAVWTAKMLTLEKDKPNSLLGPSGSAFMIHEGKDDYMTDPSGNSGGRVACAAVK